jgi:hypothetical protein
MKTRSSLLATISLLLFARIAAAQQYPVMELPREARRPGKGKTSKTQ